VLSETDPSSLYRRAKNRTPPTIDLVAKIARGTDSNPTWLAYGGLQGDFFEPDPAGFFKRLFTFGSTYRLEQLTGHRASTFRRYVLTDEDRAQGRARSFPRISTVVDFARAIAAKKKMDVDPVLFAGWLAWGDERGKP
jgi:hypothetical protein